MNYKLWIKAIAPSNEIIYEGFIHAIDASRFSSVIYMTEKITVESEVFRIFDMIQSISVILGRVVINYRTGATLEITRRQVA